VLTDADLLFVTLSNRVGLFGRVVGNEELWSRGPGFLLNLGVEFLTLARRNQLVEIGRALCGGAIESDGLRECGA
jgi:hypothetical protein